MLRLREKLESMRRETDENNRMNARARDILAGLRVVAAKTTEANADDNKENLSQHQQIRRQRQRRSHNSSCCRLYDERVWAFNDNPAFEYGEEKYISNDFF